MVPVLSSSSTSTSPGRFHRAAAHGQDVVLQQAVHAAMPMALNKPPMVVGIRQTSSAISTGTEKSVAGINAERLQRHADQQKNQRQRREQNGQRDFVRRFLARARLRPAQSCGPESLRRD